MKQKRAYKYRIYPTHEQKQILARTFGCCRYVYNWALRLRTDAFFQEQRRVSYHDTSAALTVVKQQAETSWLNEVSCVPPQQALRHLDTAFTNFFEGRASYPTFKKKGTMQSAEYTVSAFKWDGHTLTLAKMNDPLPIVWSRLLPEGCTPSTVTITKDEANRYFVSLLVEEEITPLDICPRTIGIDLGLKHMVITSDDHLYGNPRFFAQDEKKLARAQRRHARKRKGSKNREKARVKVARTHKRIADRRRDYQHQLSTTLIRENQVICVESLAVKNHCLAKAISDVGWSELVRQLEYKATWYGRTLIKIDRWYPSSKRCFDCGYIHETLDLSIREWTCPECHIHHDRDLNAAYNIHAAGLAVYACGESVRPGEVQTTPGISRRSRKPHS